MEQDWNIHKLDITAAYLNGILKETIYMGKLSMQVETNEEQEACLLKKSIYGLHQSERQWNLRLDKFLKSTGLKRSKADPCIYYDKRQEFIVGVYIDDLLILSKVK